MAEAVQKIGKEDIENKFIIQLKYGERGHPSGKEATIVLSNVKIYYTKRSRTSIKTKNAVYKNREYQEHAEGCFLHDLNDEITTLLEDGKVNKIQANLVQNYSPCRNCADKILRFKATVEQRGITFSLTIKFANFYCHWVTPNLDGLRRLKDSGVTLDLLEGENKWTEFLNDEDFVRLRNDEKEKLLNRAKSAARQNNEKKGKEIFNSNGLRNIPQPSGK